MCPQHEWFLTVIAVIANGFPNRVTARARSDEVDVAAANPAAPSKASAAPVSGRSVLVAMSGGVDSSVAAALLVEQGWDVVGVTMRLWGGESDTGCC